MHFPIFGFYFVYFNAIKMSYILIIFLIEKLKKKMILIALLLIK